MGADTPRTPGTPCRSRCTGVSPSSPGRHGLPQPWHVRASPRWPLTPFSYADRPQPSCPPLRSVRRGRRPNAIAPTHRSVQSVRDERAAEEAIPCGPSAHPALSEGTAPTLVVRTSPGKTGGRPLLPVAGAAIYAFCPLIFISTSSRSRQTWPGGQQPASTSRTRSRAVARRYAARPCAPTRARKGTKGRSLMPARQTCRRCKPGPGRSGPPAAPGRRQSCRPLFLEQGDAVVVRVDVAIEHVDFEYVPTDERVFLPAASMTGTGISSGGSSTGRKGCNRPRTGDKASTTNGAGTLSRHCTNRQQCSMNTYNVRQFANLIGVSVSTLQRWDRQGRLKPPRNGSAETAREHMRQVTR